MAGVHTVYDAQTGRVLLKDVSLREFDAWYDHHAHYRHPRLLEEVKPELREAYENRGLINHYLVQDED